MKFVRAMLAIAMLTGFSAASVAQEQIPDSVRQVLHKAVSANPDVQASWHAFQAAGNEQDAARGGFRPRVDLEAGAGRERRRVPGRSTDHFNIHGARLTLTQMLYDGFFTRSEVSRFGHARMVRYFELKGEMEDVALEALEAYLDVLRYRELVDFAKENYVEHRVIHEQIAERTESGVGRGVDLELATGRLALAESNLLTEVSNLHDVTARFVRIVGERPGEPMESFDAEVLARALPERVKEALAQAYERNPALRASVAGIRAGRELVDARRSVFHPTVDLRLRDQYDHNLEGVRGTTREGAIEVVLNYNLYRGGADRARLRQAAEELNASRDTRERVCRNVRKSLTISYHDNRMLDEQLRYLDQHLLSSDLARQAYRQQFDLGQRTLLDLLDGENEYFDARRAYTNAYYNQMLARASSLASMGVLLQVLDISREDVPRLADLAGEERYVDPETVCPPYVPEDQPIDKEALFAEAMRSFGHGH